MKKKFPLHKSLLIMKHWSADEEEIIVTPVEKKSVDYEAFWNSTDEDKVAVSESNIMKKLQIMKTSGIQMMNKKLEI